MVRKFSIFGFAGATFGALAALITPHAHAAQASPEALNSVMQAESYADLLAPIDNAAALLRTSDNIQSDEADNGNAPVELVQYYYHHHHHHHHHHYFYHHHHHHHHHHWRRYWRYHWSPDRW